MKAKTWLSVPAKEAGCPLLKRQAEPGFAAPRVGAILQAQFAAVSFGDLAAKNQTNAGAARLGGKERDEQVRGMR